MAIRFDILTTFPEMFSPDPPAALAVSIPGRARAAGLVEWHATDIRSYSRDKHRKTDERPFGGGPGMVMMCQPLWDAVAGAEALDPRPATRILLTPQGERLHQGMVEELARLERILLIAGHYEGIDERVIERLSPREVSLGDYVLSGGEMAAMVLMDAVIRLIPGALGDGESAVRESFSVADGAGGGRRLLDCPQYTRPRTWENMEVPDVLTSGDHERIARWRLERMLERTRARRPDLLPNQEAAG